MIAILIGAGLAGVVLGATSRLVFFLPGHSDGNHGGGGADHTRRH